MGFIPLYGIIMPAVYYAHIYVYQTYVHTNKLPQKLICYTRYLVNNVIDNFTNLKIYGQTLLIILSYNTYIIDV